MHDEDTGEPIRCPFCKSSEEYRHLVGVVDRTFAEYQGPLAERLPALERLTADAFFPLLKKRRRPRIRWTNEWLQELWTEAKGNSPEENDVFLESQPLHSLIGEELCEAGAVDFRGVTEGGLGMSSSLVAYYAEEPVAVIDAMLEAVARMLR
jgi:hypothetical protein